jgi:hypothetical protein
MTSSSRLGFRLWLPALLFALLASAQVGARAAPDPSPADQFVEALARQLGVEDASCAGIQASLPGQLRCGRFAGGLVTKAAHEEAFRLAKNGVPVLDVLLQGSLPQHQLAAFSGFEPLPELQGFHCLTYLIGQHRVVVWAEVETRSQASEETSRIVFSIEALGGPFPLDFPAVDSAGPEE